MAKLIYSAITSLDGCVADTKGVIEWSRPDTELHGYLNTLERPIGTYLYGRRMYEVMVGWETMPAGSDQPTVVRDFATLWKAADKVVYSATLEAVSSERTRLERVFDPAAIRRMKAGTTRDISVGGANLARQAINEGLVDEIRVFVMPLVLGGGPGALAPGVRAKLELLSMRRFNSGVVHLQYRVRA